MDKIVNFRKEARYYSKDNKRFKILLETATGCFGHCPGCGFSAEERLNPNAAIFDDLDFLFNKLNYLLEFREGLNGDGIAGEYETTVINFGAGEHFMHDINYIDELFFYTKRFFDNVPTKRNVIAFSSSGLMNIDKMNDKADVILKYLNKDQVVVDFVIDLSRFNELKTRYINSFNFFIEKFGFIDIAVNIEKDSSDRDWKALCEFLDDRGILNVDLVYAINGFNKHKVAIDADNFFNIYKTIIENTKHGISLFDTNGYVRIKEDNFSDNLEFNEIINIASKNILKDTICIDSKLNVYPALFSLFADVPLNHRFGNYLIGNLKDSNFIDLWNNYYLTISKSLYKNYLKSNICHSCEFINECYLSGMPLLNEHLNIWNNKEKDINFCQNPIRPFFQSKKNNLLIQKENDY